MKIVTKNTNKVVRILTTADREAIIATYCSKEPTDEQIERASSISDFAKSSGSWVLCDCQSSAPAYLFPRLTESGHVTLVRPRPPRQQAHANSCPFYLDDSEPVSSPPTPVPATSKPDSDFCFLKPDKPKSQMPVEPAGGQSKAVKNLPKLTRLMFMLLEGAGINTLDDKFPYDRHPNETFKFAKTIPLYPGASITIADYLSTVSQPSHYYALIARLKADNRLAETGNRKQGFVLSLANSFDDKSVTLTCGLELEVVGTIAAPTRVPTGPYWCLLLIGEQKDGSNYFEALRASIWPAYTEKTPFVVDSQPERDTLKLLISWKMYWREKGEHYVISKPIDFSSHIRPDFLVTDPESGKNVVIETMGSKEQSYLDKKVVMHQLMTTRFGKVVEHRQGDDVLTFKKAVTAAMLKDLA